jgi:hypothetical protein
MKTFYKIFCLIVINSTFAQLPTLSTTSLANSAEDLDNTNNGNYAIDTANERQQYVGIWEYSNSNTLFQIKIEKVDKYFYGIYYQGRLQGNYFFMDAVKIKYKIVVDGVVLFDNLNETNLSLVRGTGTKLGSDPYLHGSIIDEITKVGVRYEIYKTSATGPEKIIFKGQRGTMYALRPRTNITAPDGSPTFIPLNEIEMIKID